MQKRFFLYVLSVLTAGILFAAQKPDLKEIPQKRTVFSKTFKEGNENYKLVLFNQPRHYQNETGQWMEIKPEFIADGNGYSNFTNLLKSAVTSNEIRLGVEQQVIINNIHITRENEAINLFNQTVKTDSNTISLNRLNKFNVQTSFGSIRFNIEVTNIDEFLFELKLPQGWAVEKNGNFLFIKNSQAAIIYQFTIPMITVSSKVIGYGDYGINQTDEGFKIKVTLPDNLNSFTGAQLSLAITGGYEPNELTISGVEKYYENDSPVGSASYSGSNIGRWIVSDTSYYVYRAYQYFDISSLPETAEIDSAHYKITYITTSADFTVYLQQMSKHYQSTAGDLWNDCADGNSYSSFSSNVNGVYSEKYESWDDFCGDIKNNIDDGWFGIGYYTSSSPDEYTTIMTPSDTSLIIHYHDPNAYFDFTVEYDFGQGYFTIDDEFGQRNENTMYNNAYQYGSNVELTAHNQQGGDYFRVFEKWKRTIGDKPPINITDSVSSCTVTDSVNYKGNFNRRFDFQAENDFIDGGEGGELKVNGITEGAPYSRYFIENVDQSFEIEAPDQSLVVNNRTVDYYFLNWDDGYETNPRDFQPNDHYSVKALYKGHLASNNSQSTGYNNGRRMIYDQYTDIYHLVYEDNGKIFYTWSEDNGQNWSKETLLSGDGISKYPSIAGLYGRTGNGNRQVTELAVVWQEYEGYYLKIYMRRGIGVNWSQNTVMVDDLFNPEDPDAIDENFLSTPVISSRFVEPEEYYLLTIVYRYNFSSEYSGLNLSIYDTNDNDFIWNETIPNTNINCLHPSVIFQQFSDIVIHIVWSVNGHIKYINADFEEDEPVFNSIKTISSGIGGLSQSSNPFITIDKNKSALVFWHGKSNWHDGIKVIVHRRRTETGSWSGVTYFGSDYYDFEYEYFNPSVSSHPFWDNDLTLSMYSKTQGENEYKIWKSKYTYNNNSWHDPEIIANDSKYPSSCIGLGYSFSTEKDKIAFTKYSNAPYFVKVFPAGNNLNKISRENTPLAFKKSRGISIIEKNNKFTEIVFDEPMFFNNSIQWLPLADSTNAIRFSELTSVLRSKTFPIKEDSDINLKYSIYGESKFFVDAFQLELVNAQSGSVLEKWSLSDIGDGIKIYKGKSVNKAFLQISCDSNLKQNSNLNAFLFNLYTVSASDTLHKNSKFVDNTKTNHIPDNYALYQNHPNPFNPITHITFDLPEAGDVKLDVYNIKGQKVSQVMHGFKEAGIYEVIFDGKGLASGVYFYRLEVGKFSAVKRMLLVK